MRHGQRGERLLIIGNGMASVRLLEELDAAAPGRFRIMVVGAEPQAAYNRVLLSSVLSGEIGADDARLKAAEWYAARGIELVLGDAAVTLDPEAKSVLLASGRRLAFDACVLATGSAPIRLPIPGIHLPGVMTFRTADDVAAMTAAAERGERAVVIGGGLLGIEAAYGLARRGVPVTLVHIMDRLMERQLDDEAARLLQTAIEALGIEVLLNGETAEITGAAAVEGITLKDGRRVPCGLVVMAAGVRPETALAKAAGLTVARGIAVDDYLATSHAGVYAIGECAEHRGTCYGLVEPAYEQARVLAQVLAGERASYPGSTTATNLKVSGVPVFSAGELGAPDAEAITLRDSITPAYRRLFLRGGRLAGAILYGDTADALWYLDLIRSGAVVDAIRPQLVFGRSFAEAA